MTVKVRPPFSKAVVEIGDENRERYVAQGWVVVETPRPQEEPAKRRGRPPKNESE